MKSPMRALLTLLVLALLGGCANLVSKPLSQRLEHGILDNDDPRLVAEGIPAYLLLIDGGLASNPDDVNALLAGARLYGAYATLATLEAAPDDPDAQARAARLSARAFNYAGRALCLRRKALCQAPALTFDEWRERLQQADRRLLEPLYLYATAWAGFIQNHSDDWSVLADLPKVEATLERILALDPDYEQGMPELYLGVIRAQRPPALGGDPEQARAHFEAALQRSGGRNLMAKVEYARLYARLTFDQALHDRLLNEVITADPRAPGLTLINTLAQREARRLLAESAEYFEE